MRTTALAALASVFLHVAAGAADLPFRRGDSNGDGNFDISDGIATLDYLFLGGFRPGCQDAADADDTGGVDLTDAVFSFAYLFAGGPPPPSPGPVDCGTDPTPDALACGVSPSCDLPPVDTDLREAGHVLSRITYGPAPRDLERVLTIGVEAYVEEQLQPSSIDESDNDALHDREDALFTEIVPSRDVRLLAAGELWRYRPGTSAPDATWRDPDYDDSAWALGPAGFGYGDGDDATILDDMRSVEDDPLTPEDESRDGYLTVAIRASFTLDQSQLDAVGDLVLRIDYDDGFSAFLNGSPVARANVSSATAAWNQAASGLHEAGSWAEFDISAHKDRLVVGSNTLAIQGHNRSTTSSDLSLSPELVSREILPGPTRRIIAGARELQELVHVRGVYSRRQLQEVLAELWENHFTTDLDKLAEFFDDLQNSDATDAMGEAQAIAEAAHAEHLEYEFYRANALGYFGDLLLFSATSPTMLVYLDNVLNVAGAPNENYAREILELSAFGVDNRYVQRDIEELARCFTGWTICKVLPEDAQSFPSSAMLPPVECGVQFDDTVFLDVGPGWKFVRGTEEPTPGGGGEPTTEWTEIGYDDGAWTPGTTGIGYGDGDDATVLSDMRDSYVSVYMRRAFDVEDPEAFQNLIFEMAYDDGYVAYLNGVEVSRSETMEDSGSPPAHDQTTDDGHEVDESVDLVNLNRFRSILRTGTNVLAIQVHNTSIGSSDLSALPRLLDREILPGSVENGDPGAEWVFRFRPDQHDTGPKTLFSGTPWRTDVPAGRTGIDGLHDALDVVQAMAGHPSTSEFICIKLIQKLVSDDITLATFRDGTAPPELVALMDQMIIAWNSTERPGHIETVLRTLLDPRDREGLFWSDLAYRSKVKTPIEFINSSLRVVEANASGEDLPDLNDRMGMNLFTRDDPDGWSELGYDWIDTAVVLERIDFVQALAENRESTFGWQALPYLDSRELESAEEVVDYFSALLYQDTLSSANRALLVDFLSTDSDGSPDPLDRSNPTEFEARVEEFVGLLLSMPQWQFQ